MLKSVIKEVFSTFTRSFPIIGQKNVRFQTFIARCTNLASAPIIYPQNEASEPPAYQPIRLVLRERSHIVT